MPYFWTQPALLFTAAVMTTLTLFAPAHALAGTSDFDLASTSLEDLLNIEITSVTKTAQRAVESPSAVYVITSEDIRRSGYTTAPELLQLVPGVNVARFSASQWAVSVRSQNSIFGNDMLVMIDGRSVYTPLFGGTFFGLTGMHMLHVTIGVIYLGIIAFGFGRRKFSSEDVEVSGLYWHFVDLVWMLLFPLIYLMSVKPS